MKQTIITFLLFFSVLNANNEYREKIYNDLISFHKSFIEDEYNKNELKNWVSTHILEHFDSSAGWLTNEQTDFSFLVNLKVFYNVQAAGINNENLCRHLKAAEEFIDHEAESYQGKQSITVAS